MTRGEIWKDFFKKTVLTVLIAGVLFYWATLVFTKDGATNYFYVWLCCGIPFGIRRMFVWLIPRGFDPVSYTHLMRSTKRKRRVQAGKAS